jgi:hypothetical protein
MENVTQEDRIDKDQLQTAEELPIFHFSFFIFHCWPQGPKAGLGKTRRRA